MRILVKKGFKLNPNEKVVKSIIKAVERNNGLCPCVHNDDDGDLHCPCESYRKRDHCCCQLYIKENQ